MNAGVEEQAINNRVIALVARTGSGDRWFRSACSIRSPNHRDCVETAGGITPGAGGVVTHVGALPEGVAPGRLGDPAGRLESGEEGP